MGRPKQIDRLLTLKDVMEIIPRSKKTVMGYIKHLPRVELGRTVYWKESVIRDFIDANETTRGGETWK
jgi:predicted DNA-binding transcriptional regulator AlpA